MELVDKVVVVTGAGSGIGAAMARRFAAEGAAGVALVDLHGEAVEAVAAQIGDRARPFAADVADQAAIEAVVDEVERTAGPVDLFCANAGIGGAGGLDAPDEEWERVWKVNTLSHLYAARVVVPRMVARGGGYLLTTASAAGLLSNIANAPYSVTKHAAVALAEWIAITYGHAGIKVSCLCPQGVRTPLVTDNPDDPAIRAVLSQPGILEAEEVADAVVAGLAAERFLILPHPEVADYYRLRATDTDRWLAGMRRLQTTIYDPLA